MKTSIILIIALFIPAVVLAQNVDYAEYFVDSDPGFALATPVAVSGNGTDFSLDFSADVAGLQQGFHFISVRVRDDQGRWSHPVNRFFFLVRILEERESNLEWLEHFIDTDPGVGQAVITGIRTPSNEIIIDLSPELEGLDQGIHYIHFRAKDYAGRWGSVMNSAFFVVGLPPSEETTIQQVEFFVNDDPGYGLATQVNLPSVGSDLLVDFSVPIGGLGDGNHILHIRAKDDMNRWGPVYAEVFNLTGTGTDEQQIRSLFKIFPNPSSGLVQVEITDPMLKANRIFLTDLSGKLFYETDLTGTQTELDLNLPGGIYLIHVEGAENKITQKLILQ